MTSARRLYERHGFRQIPHSLGNTGHSGCDVFYVKNLRTP
jgi:putative acetyltransferase